MRCFLKSLINHEHPHDIVLTMELNEVHEIIADQLAEIQQLFHGDCTLTLIMCNDDADNGDLIIGNYKSIDRVIEALKKAKSGEMTEHLTSTHDRP